MNAEARYTHVSPFIMLQPGCPYINLSAPIHKHILNLRQIWCEGSFAAQKWKHNLRRLFRRGLEAAEDHCLLSATALNLKRMVKCLG